VPWVDAVLDDAAEVVVKNQMAEMITTTLKPNDEELGGQYVKFSECIYNRLVRLNHTVCSCHEEYEALSEMIAYSSLSLYDDTCVNAEAAAKFPTNEEIDVAARTLIEYFDKISLKDAEALIRDAALDAWDKNNNAFQSSACDNDDQEEDNYNNTNVEIHDDDDDGEYICEGECELCERNVKLTRHHLVPKSTWPKMKKRLWNAATIIELMHQHSSQMKDNDSYAQGVDDDDEEKREQERLLLQSQLFKILGDRFDITYLPTTITNDSIRNYLARVCHLCRQCHSAVHRIHSSEGNWPRNITQWNDCSNVRRFFNLVLGLVNSVVEDWQNDE
jgi:hypothetical protein